MPLIQPTDRGMRRTRLKTLIGILVAVAALLTVLGFFVDDRLKAQRNAASAPAPGRNEEEDRENHL